MDPPNCSTSLSSGTDDDDVIIIIATGELVDISSSDTSVSVEFTDIASVSADNVVLGSTNDSSMTPAVLESFRKTRTSANNYYNEASVGTKLSFI